MATRDPNRVLVGRILLYSAVFLGLLAVVFWLGWVPVEPHMRELFTVGLAVCAVAEALVAVFLLMRS